MLFWGAGDFFGVSGIFFVHESSSYGQIRLTPKFQLPRQTPSGRKVCGRKKESGGQHHNAEHKCTDGVNNDPCRLEVDDNSSDEDTLKE